MTRVDTTISLSNVYKRFGDIEAVSDITSTIKTGEIVGFVGPNGAGKTTTISMLLGFIRPTKGKLYILGTQVLPEIAHKVHQHIGYVAGDMVLPSSLTGAQYLSFVAAQNGRDDKQYKQLLHQLSPILDRPIKSLSRGNKQKIALLGALQHDPKILILDEPTSGLDPLMQEVFLSVVKQQATHGTTVLMSSHILSEVSTICERVIFMKSGKFIVDKALSDITAQLGKYVTISSPEAHTLQKFTPSYARIITASATELCLSVNTNDLKPLLRWITTKQFTDVTIEDRDLDTIFHELYIGTKGATQ